VACSRGQSAVARLTISDRSCALACAGCSVSSTGLNAIHSSGKVMETVDAARGAACMFANAVSPVRKGPAVVGDGKLQQIVGRVFAPVLSAARVNLLQSHQAEISRWIALERARCLDVGLRHRVGHSKGGGSHFHARRQADKRQPVDH
jgi:hypothetical protein